VNSAGHTPTLRRVLTPQRMVELFTVRRVGTEDAPAILAEVFESFDDDELVGLVIDAGALAGDLNQPPGIRRLAASLACVAESALTGLTSWDALYDLIDAGLAVRAHERNTDGSKS
jgi:hypothetical protein